MCVSTVYLNKKEDKNVLMKNVMNVSANGGLLSFTDIMERKLSFKGELLEANLVDGYIIVKGAKDE